MKYWTVLDELQGRSQPPHNILRLRSTVLKFPVICDTFFSTAPKSTQIPILVHFTSMACLGPASSPPHSPPSQTLRPLLAGPRQGPNQVWAVDVTPQVGLLITPPLGALCPSPVKLSASALHFYSRAQSKHYPSSNDGGSLMSAFDHLLL